jgi:hypothetical protein
MTNTGAGTDTMTVRTIQGLGRGTAFVDWSMNTEDVNGGAWVVIFSSTLLPGDEFGHFAQSIRSELSKQAYAEDLSGVTVNCEYNDGSDTYSVVLGDIRLPLKAFDFHPVY